MTLQDYIRELNAQLATGQAREHSYRPALKAYVEAILGTDYTIINEPARIACGAPDYVICRGNMNLAYIEAKDIGDRDLLGREPSGNKAQFDRYKQALSVVLFTDYLDCHLYIRGERRLSLSLGELTPRGIKALPGAEAEFREMLRMMTSEGVEVIRSIPELSRLMASKAYLLMHTIRTALETEGETTSLAALLAGFRSMLMHDLSEDDFANTYAQTIVYGLFAARYNDTSLDSFSREKAVELIPETNPFLRFFFADISGVGLDPRIAWIVEDLVQIFAKTDLKKLFREYSERTGMSDPLMHFYEDFLSAYNPELRKSKGVWYTPAPVVRFMVRAVDELLQRDFGLEGLEDNSKILRKVRRGSKAVRSRGKDPKTVDKGSYEPVELHRLQFLDPATGTGTFPAEILRQIYAKYEGNEGLWLGDVAHEVLPRLNAFEYLMAPYAIAHLKLSMLLSETGYRAGVGSERLRIYLTNSLEEHNNSLDNIEQMFGLQRQVAEEARQADDIKEQLPIMVLIGNPPYNGSSSNKGEWIMKLMEDYKKEPGGILPLKERNPKWINDDYMKFIRLAQDFVERNGEGIICYINPHGYLDNPTFRGVRWQLLKTFDTIYTIDLHGNSTKKEKTPEGGKDENVFDIKQGVSINIFVRRGGERCKDAMAQVWHYDLYGKRKDKYIFLENATLSNIDFVELQPRDPFYFFVPKDFDLEEEYNEGFSLQELFIENSVGLVTTKDDYVICDTQEECLSRIQELIDMPEAFIREKYGLKDTRDWTIARAKADVGSEIDRLKAVSVAYRPFEKKYLYYTKKSTGLVARPRAQVLGHMLGGDNLGLIINRQVVAPIFNHAFVSMSIVELHILETGNASANLFPLYQSYREEAGEDGVVQRVRPTNLKAELLKQIETKLGEAVQPEELFDYIYSVLHRRDYRERYREFLKIDFPRIPYPSSPEQYHREAERGHRLRLLHLMQGLPSDLRLPHKYPIAGENRVDKPRYVAPTETEAGRIYLNGEQYFEGVTPEVWGFYIGGYQPAQKWLKDHGKKGYLTSEEIQHYRRILYILGETHSLMQD